MRNIALFVVLAVLVSFFVGCGEEEVADLSNFQGSKLARDANGKLVVREKIPAPKAEIETDVQKKDATPVGEVNRLDDDFDDDLNRQVLPTNDPNGGVRLECQRFDHGREVTCRISVRKENACQMTVSDGCDAKRPNERCVAEVMCSAKRRQ